MRVLIVGAGIGGLAAAQGLIGVGHEVTVLEQAPALRDGGGAVTIWHNGAAVLDDLSVSLDGLGQRISVLELLSAGGRRVSILDVDELTARLGAPTIVTPRRHLLNRLARGLPDGTIRFDARFSRLCTAENGVRIRTDDGAEHVGDVLIGADGVHSRVRAALFGRSGGSRSSDASGKSRNSGVRATGVASWQALVPDPFRLGSRSILLVGRAGDCGLMGAGEGLLQCWFDVPWPVGATMEEKPLRLLRKRYGHWCSPVPELLGALTDDDLEVFPHSRHGVAAAWGSGPCTLLGDAAHAMPPSLAQGLNQTLEDVLVLVRCLGLAAHPDTALRSYERMRRRRSALASAVAARSLAVTGPGSLVQTEGPLRLASAIPDRLVTRAFGALLRTVSNRL